MTNRCSYQTWASHF